MESRRWTKHREELPHPVSSLPRNDKGLVPDLNYRGFLPPDFTSKDHRTEPGHDATDSDAADVMTE
jgi:hypothetical protein